MSEFNTWSSYIRDGRAFFPTIAGELRLKVDVEPVTVVSASDKEAVIVALKEQISKGNVPDPSDYPKPPVVLKYAKVKSWRAFENGLVGFSLLQRKGNYLLRSQKRGQDGHLVDDLSKEVIFSGDTPLDDVIRRSAEIIVALNAEAVGKPSPS